MNQLLRKAAIKELTKAICLLPNKEYCWEFNTPLIVSKNEEVLRINVQRISYTETLNIEGIDTDSNQTVEVSLEHVDAQDMFFLIENIDEDNNVSINGLQEKITLLCNDLMLV